MVDFLVALLAVQKAGNISAERLKEEQIQPTDLNKNAFISKCLSVFCPHSNDSLYFCSKLVCKFGIVGYHLI